MLGPVDQIEIKIVLQGRRIQDLEWHLTYLSPSLDRTHQFFGEIQGSPLLEGLPEGEDRLLLAKLEQIIVLEQLDGVVRPDASLGLAHNALLVDVRQRQRAGIGRGRRSVLTRHLFFPLLGDQLRLQLPASGNEAVSHDASLIVPVLSQSRGVAVTAIDDDLALAGQCLRTAQRFLRREGVCQRRFGAVWIEESRGVGVEVCHGG